MKTLATIENRTEFPPAVVTGVIGWVLSELDADGRNVLVRVHYTDHWHALGHFFSDEDFVWAAGFEHLLVLKLPGPLGYPYTQFMGTCHADPRTWDEALVCVCAHEATHLKQCLGPERTAPYVQMRAGKPVHVDGAKLVEAEAEDAECRLLQLYRERRNA